MLFRSVEFARDLHAQGRTAVASAIDAAHIRMRPIVMTSLAFGLGVLPLALANGAGSESENSVGIGVLGGMSRCEPSSCPCSRRCS